MPGVWGRRVTDAWDILRPWLILIFVESWQTRQHCWLHWTSCFKIFQICLSPCFSSLLVLKNYWQFRLKLTAGTPVHPGIPWTARCPFLMGSLVQMIFRISIVRLFRWKLEDFLGHARPWGLHCDMQTKLCWIPTCRGGMCFRNDGGSGIWGIENTNGIAYIKR